MRLLVLRVVFLALLTPHLATSAQSLPPPSRTVFRCEVEGKVVYSDSPCPAAKRVDVTPTRGLDKSTGQQRTGDDVRREKHNEMMTEAMRPILNETPDQRAVRHKRFKLGAKAKAECHLLDGRIAELEAEEARVAVERAKDVQRELYARRVKYRELGC